jgi:translation initiation factor 2B subunit (eIF-2B alpha/beta/delta family)
MMIPPAIRADISDIAEDRVSGATALVLRAIRVLKAAARERALLQEVADALCQAQPSMAGFRTAAALANAAPDAGMVLDTLSTRVRRAPAAIARLAAPVVALRAPTSNRLTIVTCSRSESVERTLEALNGLEPVLVRCSESWPGREGAALAEALATKGLQVELYSDAGIGCALAGAHALVVGADALAGTAFINKVGTAALCALARALGISVYVLAGSEKILPERVFQTLPLRDVTDELDDSPYVRRTPLFERIPAGLVSHVVTDRAVTVIDDIHVWSLWKI